MSQTLTLELPDEVYQAIRKEANAHNKTVEQVALDWMSQHVTPCQDTKPRRGSVEAILPFLGAWKMTTEERERIEREIYQDRHRGYEDLDRKEENR